MIIYDGIIFDASKYAECSCCGGKIFLGGFLSTLNGHIFCENCLPGVDRIILSEKEAENIGIKLKGN